MHNKYAMILATILSTTRRNEAVLFHIPTSTGPSNEINTEHLFEHGFETTEHAMSKENLPHIISEHPYHPDTPAPPGCKGDFFEKYKENTFP